VSLPGTVARGYSEVLGIRPVPEENLKAVSNFSNLYPQRAGCVKKKTNGEKWVQAMSPVGSLLPRDPNTSDLPSGVNRLLRVLRGLVDPVHIRQRVGGGEAVVRGLPSPIAEVDTHGLTPVALGIRTRSPTGA